MWGAVDRSERELVEKDSAKISRHDDWQAAANDGVDYHYQWQVYALRWYTTLFLLLGWVPISVWLFYRSRNGWHQPLVALGIILMWLATMLAMVWWTGEFRCPRCRRRYGALGNRKGDTNFTRGFFDRVCANCKLRKFERG